MRSRYQESNSSWHYCHGERSKGKSNKSQTLSLCHAGIYCQSSRLFAKGSCKRPWLEHYKIELYSWLCNEMLSNLILIPHRAHTRAASVYQVYRTTFILGLLTDWPIFSLHSIPIVLGQIAVTQSRFDRHTLSRGLELHYHTMLGQLGDQPNYPEGFDRTHSHIWFWHESDSWCENSGRSQSVPHTTDYAIMYNDCLLASLTVNDQAHV